MNFKDATHIRDIIWYEGPLLSQLEHNGKTYLIKWVDVTDDQKTHTWMIFEVQPEILDLYFAKMLTLRQLEDRAPTAFMLEGYADVDEAAWIDIDNAPEDWKARSNSYYDTSLMIRNG